MNTALAGTAQPASDAFAQTLALGTGEHIAYERDATVDALFAQGALHHPDAVAVLAEGRTVSYGQLERDANRVANFLIARGVGAGAVVGVALERCVELPAVLLGTLRAGAAYLPLDPATPFERLAFMVADAGAGLIVSDERLAGFPELPAARIDVASALSAPAEPVPAGVHGPASTAYIMYTSGSTGRPKGVAVEHRGILRLVRGTRFADVDPTDTFLQFAPPAFDAATFEIWGALLNGARLAIPKPGLIALDELGRTIERFDVTTLWLTATVFREAVEAQVGGFQHLRRLLTGGDVVSPSHARQFLNAAPACRLINGYGPTENTTFSCCYEIPATADFTTSLPIGTPIANSTAYVLDARLQPVAPGEAGELCVGGDGVARGYVNLPELTAERFVSDPFSQQPDARMYRTGDRARWRSDGLLEFLGRSDDQIKVRGFRIELGEIESALLAHQDVRHAAVVGIERDGRKDIVAHVVPVADANLDEAGLRALLARTLPPYMVPHRIVVRGDLPRHASGKIDRLALARASGPTTVRRLVRDDGSRALERTIGEIWHELLGRECDVDENFFDAGGDSIRLLAMHARLCARSQADISVTDIFAHGTIRKLAAFVAGAGARA